MRLKKSFVVFLIISALFLSACTGIVSRDRGDVYRKVDFHVGSEGVYTEFFPGTPPHQIYEGDDLNIVVKYSNRGATDVEAGKIYLSGFDNYYIPMDRVEITMGQLEGKSIYNPEGFLYDSEEFNARRVKMPENVDIFPQTFKVTTCYKYKTEASAQVCIDTDPLGREVEDKVCFVHDVGLGTQGAPVAVTGVQQDIGRDKVNFKISVSNVGGGTVLSSHNKVVALNNCHSSLERDEVDQIEIEAKLANRALTCKPDVIRLVNGVGYSLCQLSGLDNTKDAYLTSLNIDLYYGYKSSIARQVQILKLP